MSTSRWGKFFAIAVAIASGVSTSARADIVYENLQTPVGSLFVHETLWYAQAFIPAAGGPLSVVDLNLAGPLAGFDNGGFFVQLRSNLAGTPGAVIETLTGDDTPPAGIIPYTSSANPVLAAGTTYWIALTVAPNAAANPTYLFNYEQPSTPTIGTSVDHAFTGNGVTWTPQTNFRSINLRVSTLAAVPEVAPWMTWGLGAVVGGLGWASKRRRLATG